MQPSRSALVSVFAAALAIGWSPFSGAAPQIGYLYPAGGQRGTTFRVEIGGQSLRNVDGIHVSGKGVRASVLEYIRPLDNEELRKTERFLRDLVKRRWSASVMAEVARKADGPALPDHPWLRDLDEKTPNELDRLRIRLSDPKRQPNAQISEQVVLEITVDPDALLGDRELRVVSPDGLSNPLCFQVGVLPEVCEKDIAGGPAGQVVDLPVLLNGQVTPGETDRIRLRAGKGQHLVFRLHARHLIPYLADAVPGWFQATMALYDPNGNEVVWSDDYRFDPDPVLLYEIPADGVYELEIRDAIYRGRDDFVYRIAVGELPFVTHVFPLGGRAGTPVTAAIQGWNLPTETLQFDTGGAGGTIRRVAFGADQGGCSDVCYAVDALPEATEVEPNDGTSEAQNVTFPLVVNGRISQPGDIDVFRFAGRAGQEVVAEVVARRLNSPLDSVLRLVDATGKQVGLNDDCKDPEMGLVTHQADSYVRLQLPHDGPYLVYLSDAQRQGGEAYAYRLHLRSAQPDVALRLIPSGVNVPVGRSATVTVRALPKDGFAGDVDLVLVNAPNGFTLSTARIPAGQGSVQARISAPSGVPRQVLPVQIEGRCRIGEVEVSRPVIPAEDMMQAFLWRFLVPQQELLVAVTGPRAVPAVWRPLVPGIRLANATPVRIPLGGTTQVQVAAPRNLPDRGKTALASIRFSLSNRPRGVTLREASVGPTGVILTLKADPNTALAGDVANAIIEASVESEAGSEAAQSAGRKSRISLGVLPAIPFEVVEP